MLKNYSAQIALQISMKGLSKILALFLKLIKVILQGKYVRVTASMLMAC